MHYVVWRIETDDEKYNKLRALISAKNCPTIIYVSRTHRTKEIAEKLTSDGFSALPFHGQMEPNDKIANQRAFINNEVKIIVATSAFGMGVDKKDVGLVIHYDISDSLENYMQESGRAGRDQSLKADCYVLYNDEDLNKHFILLNQTKLSKKDIQQVWKAIKKLAESRNTIYNSPLEIARAAGWDDSVYDIETRVKTAVAALEKAGFIERGRNVPQVYATSILAKNMVEASLAIERSNMFDEKEREAAKRIIKLLISSRSRAEAGTEDAESRIDYIADRLGLEQTDVISLVNRMRLIKLLADSQDMTAYIHRSETQNKAIHVLERFIKLEEFILSQIEDCGSSFNLKELNESAEKEGVKGSNIKNIRTINYFWTIKGYMAKTEYNSQNRTDYNPTVPVSQLMAKIEKRYSVCKFVVDELYRMSENVPISKSEDAQVQFSLGGLFEAYEATPKMDFFDAPVTISDIEDAILYLSKIGAISLHGGFLVSYNRLQIKRLETNNRIQYTDGHYSQLNDFYKHKIQQIHIVGEYANLMVNDFNAAMQFVNDYFTMDYERFVAKYFKGERRTAINRNITAAKYKQIFGNLSNKQLEIINDESKYIVVAAGPGSGKTMVLVHKLASLLQLEDVKHEQLLMVTFSRAAATEFKKRLIALIGNAAAYVEIKTFHSYCFDLLGKPGNLEASENVVKEATEMINNGEVEPGRITKTVVVIDEAQDMDENEFALIKALASRNDDMRIIAVGDDDQNIYEFRGSNSKYLQELLTYPESKKHEMTENYRSCESIVDLSNAFAKTISNRMKVAYGVAVKKQEGIVRIINHDSDNLEQPIVEEILKRRHNGSICVLTSTNDEALRVLGLLNKNKVSAKLIQSTDGFQMYNLVEIRYFLHEIDKELRSPVISDSLWKDAKAAYAHSYGNSACFKVCSKMIADFEKTNKTKYRTELEEFIKESKYEDFYTEDSKTVLVSTTHKSKGREFDVVYMLLNNVSCRTNEEKRRIYVGMTRAKEELYIHCNNNLFDRIAPISSKIVSDKKQYKEPDEIMLQLSYRDVYLDYFKYYQGAISQLKSGDELQIEDAYLSAIINGKTVRIAKYSKSFVDKLAELKEKGYTPTTASVRFMLWWKGQDDDVETIIVLPDLCLKKK